MQITRNNHLRYMAKLTPALLIVYVLQAIIYKKFAPAHVSGDVNLVLGVGLAILILLYQFYDHHHKIIFKENYLETRFDLLKIKEEVLYRNIEHIEVKKSRFYYANITLHLKDGSTCNLHHVDSPELISEYIEKKKCGRI